MAVYKRKDTVSHGWYYKFTIDGVTYKKAIPAARTRRQAEDAERAARQDVHNGMLGILPDVSFVHFVNTEYLPYAERHLKNIEDIKVKVKPLCDFFKGMTLRQISTFQVEKFKLSSLKVTTQYKKHRKASTVNQQLVMLSSILSHAVRIGRLRENSSRKVKRLPVEATKLRILSYEEEILLLESAEKYPGFIKPVIQLALWLGWRESEIMKLRKSDIDFAHNLVFVRETKWAKDPRKTKGVPMSQIVRELLFELVRECKTEELFFNRKTGTSLDRTYCYRVFKKVCSDTGIEDLRFHDLRHTFGTRLGEAGVGVEKIARAMGHSDIATTLIYVHTSQSTMQDVMEQAARNAQSSSRIVPHAFAKVG